MSHGVQGKSRPGQLDGVTAGAVAEVMHALSAPSRLRILGRLRDGPCSVSQLAAAVGMEQSAVSHQLRVLRHLRLVVGERRGRHVVYALHDPHLEVLLNEAVFHVEHVRLDRPGHVAATEGA